MPPKVRYALGLAVALAALAGAGFVAMMSLLWASLRCDDHCSTIGGWRYSTDAWQWDALGWLGPAGFVFALAVVVCSAFRRYATAAVALAAAAVCDAAAIWILAAL